MGQFFLYGQLFYIFNFRKLNLAKFPPWTNLVPKFSKRDGGESQENSLKPYRDIDKASLKKDNQFGPVVFEFFSFRQIKPWYIIIN